jgi:FHS family L-fucose permease-like MFS transporter
LNLQAVQVPYLVLGAAFIIAAVIFKFSRIPDQVGDDSSSNQSGGIL